MMMMMEMMEMTTATSRMAIRRVHERWARGPLFDQAGDSRLESIAKLGIAQAMS